jgi:Flp pilus assembly protein CpaB
MSLGEAPQSTERIVVARTDLAPGTPLRTSLLQVKPQPVGFKWDGHLRPVDLVHFAGARVRRAIRQGEAIRRVDLAGHAGRAGGPSKVLPAGTRAVTLSVDWVGGRGAWVRAGDHVDIGAIFGRDKARPVLRILMQHVRVMAAEHWDEKPAAGAAGRARWVMVLTLAREAQALALAQRLGRIVLFPRGAQDRRPVRYPPVTRQHLESPAFWQRLQMQRKRVLRDQAPDDPGIRVK